MSTKNTKQTTKSTTKTASNSKGSKPSKKTDKPAAAVATEKRPAPKETDVASIAEAAVRRLRDMEPKARRAFLGNLRRGELGAIAGELRVNAVGVTRAKLEAQVLEALAAEKPATTEAVAEGSTSRKPERADAAVAPAAPQDAHGATEDAAATDTAPIADEAPTGEPVANDAQPAAPEPATRTVEASNDEPHSDAGDESASPIVSDAAQPAKYYTLDGKLVDIEQILASKTILNGIAISDFDVDAIPSLLPGDAIHLETELAGTFTLRCEAAPPAEDAKRYTVDGESVAIEEFIADNTAENVEPLAEDEIARLRALQPGEELVLGGGAAGETVVRCEPPTPARRYTIEGDEIDLEQFITMNAAPRGALDAVAIERLRALRPGDELLVHAGTIEYSIRCEAATAGSEARPEGATNIPIERDPRLPPVGTVIQKKDRHGAVRCECTVERDGIRFAGKLYKSLSAAAIAASKDLGLGGKTQNGFTFWGLSKPARNATTTSSTDKLDSLDRAWERYQERVASAAKDAGSDERAKVRSAIQQHIAKLNELAAQVA